MIGVGAAGRRHMMADDGVETRVPSHRYVIRRRVEPSMRKAFLQPFVVLYSDFVGVLAIDRLIEGATRIHAPCGLAKLIRTEFTVRA